MSLLSTESLSLFLSPADLVVVRWRGVPRQIVDKRIYPVTAGTEGNAWSEAVNVLAVVLRETACQQVSVIVSCRLTQYQLVPWRDDLHDNEEELAVVRLAFIETFGDAAARWSVRLSDEPPGIPRLAAAIDAELIGAIEQTATAARVRLVSVQPYLVAVANNWRKHFDRGQSRWLVLHEENRVCLALIDHGRWHWVRCIRVGADWCERLPEIVEHEILLAATNDSVSEVLVFAPDHPMLTLPAGTRLPFRRLRMEARTGFSPTSDGQFGFALIG